MTSSPEKPKGDGLPPGLASMWRLCKLGYRHEPGLLLAAFTLALLSALPDALLALWLTLLGEGALQADWSLVRFGAVALGVSATATWFLQTVSTRVQRRFRDKVTIALESHVATLRHRSPRSRTRSVPSISIALPSCAIRSSCWTTCTCPRRANPPTQRLFSANE